jgi:predicted  nucleic acid-binding Zn-ribbon protein
MISRRQETPSSFEPPVRFYKFIAITFLLLTVVLLGVVLFMSSKRATITITAKNSPENITVDVVLGEDNPHHGVEGSVTTTVVTLEKRFSPTGDREEDGTAEGVVTLHNDSDAAQPLVKTTRLLTPDGTLFRLSEGVTVPANGSLPTVAVYADKEGKSGDIGPVERFTIPGLNESRQKEVYASSDEAMRGGVRTIGVLSQKDVEDAKKELEVLLEEKGTELLAAGKKDTSAIYSVVSFDASTEAEVGEEMSEFILSGTARVAAVSYDANALTEWATMQLAKKAISDAEKLHSASDAPTLTFASYDASNNTATIRVFYDGSYTLNPESRQIEKSMFFGKNRDEVRRYVLSLDHVSGVEVDLQPAWMQTVPHVHDHVTVIVKEVE